jgi:hypothetical protein
MWGCGFCSKLRAPHRGTSLGPFVGGARDCLLCSYLLCSSTHLPSVLLLLPQAAIWAPAWAPQSRMCAHVDNGASTPETLCAAGVGGATAAKTCVCRLKHASAPPSTTIKYVRRTASGAAGNGVGKTIKYLRRTRNCAAGNGLGTTIKYLRQTTAADNRLATTIKYIRSAVGIGFGNTTKYCAQCLCVYPELPPCVHKQNPTRIPPVLLRRLKTILQYFKKIMALNKPAPSPPSLRLQFGKASTNLASLAPPERLHP